ncbi:sensor histidine kinase [Hyphomonas johnsonii]|nr:sensor histidine kinase [Hyphomonas johnsonii]
MTLAAALTPILVLSVISAYLDANKGMDERRANLLLVADAAIDGVEQSIQEASLLLSLYQTQVFNGQCSGIFKRLSPHLPAISNIIAFDTEGRPTCSAVGNASEALSNQNWNERLKRGERVIRSDTFFDDKTKQWIFAVLLRQDGADGAYAGSIGVELQTDELAALPHAYLLPAGVDVALLDDRGETFGSSRFSSIDPEWVEKVQQSRTAELFVLHEPQAGSLDVVIKPVGEGNLFAAISRASPGIWSDFTLRPVSSIGLPLITFSVALLAVWLAIDSLVLAWISRLTRTVRVYGAGRYQFNAGRAFDEAPDEIAKLARAMDVMAKDIGERDKDLKLAIASRDAAVREIHHRVKNNLQIVTSFLNLQGRQLRDPQAKAAISAARHRIDALAIVHQTLYQNERLEQVHLRPFLTGLVSHLSEALGMEDSGIAVEQAYADVMRPADDAIPMALFVVEAITNAMKYAFDGTGGRIRTSLDVFEGGMRLEIADDGRGYDPEILSGGNNGSGLGSKLMSAFSRQLAADLTIETSPGNGCKLILIMPDQA